MNNDKDTKQATSSQWHRTKQLLLLNIIISLAGLVLIELTCSNLPTPWVIFPLIIISLSASIFFKAWVALGILLIFNPISYSFIEGVVDYLGGEPTILGRGLFRGAGFRVVDRKTRSYMGYGGCVIYKQDWVYLTPHNQAIRLMSYLFGFPSNTYDGPFPSDKEALEALKKADITYYQVYLKGWINNRGKYHRLPKSFVRNTFLYKRLTKPMVASVVYKKRCLILRLSEFLFESKQHLSKDMLIFFDLKKSTPFYYTPLPTWEKFTGRTRSWVPPLPPPERCNGKDDDGDGQVDENFPKKGKFCQARLGGCLISGTFVCGKDGKRVFCKIGKFGKPHYKIRVRTKKTKRIRVVYRHKHGQKKRLYWTSSLSQDKSRWLCLETQDKSKVTFTARGYYRCSFTLHPKERDITVLLRASPGDDVLEPPQNYCKLPHK